MSHIQSPYLQLSRYEDGTATFIDEAGEMAVQLPLDRWTELGRPEYIRLTVFGESA